MIRLVASVEIEAPVGRVWSVLCDVEKWPEWTSTVTSVRCLDNGPFSIGSRAEIRQPRLRPAVWKVTKLRDRNNFTWITRNPGVRITAGHQLEPNGTGTRVTLSLEFTGPLGSLVGRLYRNLSQRYVQTEADALRARAKAWPSVDFTPTVQQEFCPASGRLHHNLLTRERAIWAH